MSKIAELEDLNENLAYENKKMGDFLELLGLTANEITDVVVNGAKINLDIIRKMETKVSVLERKFVKDEIRRLDKLVQEQ